MKKNGKFLLPVSVVVVHRNSSSTIIKTLEGIKKQDYPIKEIIIVDNKSTDDSLDKIKDFSAYNKSLHIKVLTKKINTGIGNSYNMGVDLASSNHIILMQADGFLPSKKEISTVISPALQANNIAATTSYIVMPRYVWDTYNFWEKCMFAPALEKDLQTFSGKFNYINKQLFLRAGGFDEKNFNSQIGGEDVDLTIRLKKIGEVVETNARVIHLHYLGKNYSLMSWVLNRKLLARTFGKIAKMHGFNLSFKSKLLILKPCLVFFSCFIFFSPFNFIPIIIFVFIYMEVMYTTKSTYTNPRIFLLPFISLALVYYETFWMIKEFFAPVEKWRGMK